jgi:asparagine synthase (glutamine-hydrolysing)
MLEVLQPRGPDDGGVWQDGALLFGHRRLSIIDLSDRSHQPMVVTDGAGNSYAVVFNGTIYNYRELRDELVGAGHSFRSSGDTEVILRAYQQWGESCVEHFEGMFAFAIWNSTTRELYLARDRMGIKPLYWLQDCNRILFASTLPTLLAADGVDRELDAAALHNHFTLHGVVPAPRTLFKSIHKMEPAHWIRFSATGEAKKSRYWSLKAVRPAQSKSEWEWAEEVRDALLRAVEIRRAASDLPVGVLLSGGLDSSLLVGMLSEAGHRDIRTFSIGFEDSPEESGNEFIFSDAVVEKFQTKHTKITIPNDRALSRLSEAVDAMSEPMFGQDAIGFYLLAEQVSKDVHVVLSGQGADEVFGGYFWYPQMAENSEGYGSSLDRFRNHYFDRDHPEMLRLLTKQYRGQDWSGELMQTLLNQPDAETFMDQVLRADTTALVVDDPVKRVDNMTMAWGLEARVPFLDHKLVELAASIPPELKLKHHGKGPLKLISRGLLPDSVIDRPKGYFPMPALKYVRGEFLEFMQDILGSQQCRERGLYDRAYIEKLLNNPTAKESFTRIQGSKLWQLALTEYWLQSH